MTVEISVVLFLCLSIAIVATLYSKPVLKRDVNMTFIDEDVCYCVDCCMFRIMRLYEF